MEKARWTTELGRSQGAAQEGIAESLSTDVFEPQKVTGRQLL